MKQEINRVTLAIKQWQEQESRFENLFPGTLSNNRPFLKDKLDYLDSIQARLGRSSTEEERLTLNILRQQRRTLAKAVYPNRIARLIHYILLPFRQRKVEQLAQRKTATNIQSLKEMICKAGFRQILGQLEAQIKQGADSFAIPLSYYVNEKERMDYTLSFNQDSTGQYHWEGYDAALYTANKQSGEKKHNFQMSAGSIPGPDQAYHLLAGRAVNVKHQQWMQLDLNDKDPSGNFKIKAFPEAYGYDLVKTVEQLPLKDSSSEAKDKLLDAIKSGGKPEILLLHGNGEMKISVEANPQHKTLNVFDEQQKKISLSSVLNNGKDEKQKECRKIVFKQVIGRGKRNGQSI